MAPSSTRKKEKMIRQCNKRLSQIFASLRSFSVCQRGRCIIFENLSMSFRLQITRKALLPPTDIVCVSVEAWKRVPFYFRIILSSVAEIKL